MFTAAPVVDPGSSKTTVIRPRKRTGKKSDIATIDRPAAAPVSYRPECNNPLDRFCELLLNWSISDTDKNKQHEVNEERTVPLTFSSYSSYVKTWEPLLIIETRACILSSIPTKCGTGSVRACPVDMEHVSSPLVKLQCALSNDTDNSATRATSVGVMSLLLFSSIGLESSGGSALPNELPDKTSYFLGLVTSQQRGNELQVSAFRTQFTTFLKVDENAAKQKFRQRGTTPAFMLNYKVLGGLTSSFREFLALHEAYRMPIIHSLLNPVASSVLLEEKGEPSRPDTPPHVSPPRGLHIPASEVPLGELRTEDSPYEEKSRKSTSLSDVEDVSNEGGNGKTKRWEMEGVGVAFNRHLHGRYNDSQLQAIRSAVETPTGFCLIQGPPGTGKTSTILGLLNSVHIRDYNIYFEALLQRITGPDGLRCREKGLDPIPWVAMINSLTEFSKKPHLLVVAPSNVAVDNIIQRIVEQGFKDSSGCIYYPNILRVGSGGAKSSSARAVSLDEAVDTILSEENDGVDRIVSTDTEITSAMRDILQSIIGLQTILLNMKLSWQAHPLGPGWELRILQESARPYWVDHYNKRTSNTPPPPPPQDSSMRSDYTLETLPEYKFYTHLIVQKLEELRVLHLQKVRVRTVSQHRSGGRGRGVVSTSLRRSLETSFIEEADIVFTTLNSSGHPCLEGSVFPVVIIDEAAQCVEPSTLIPLRMGCIQCIMVGDQNQLSATVFAKSLTGGKGFDRSLFERLVGSRSAVMLDTQYRMLPQISRFPSMKFYHGNLKDGENVCTKGYGPFYLGAPQEDEVTRSYEEPAKLKPFLFFDLKSSRDVVGDSASRSNIEEARLCLQLIELIIYEASKVGAVVGSIGVITPYQEQLSELYRLFEGASLLPRNSRPGSTEREKPTTSKAVISQAEEEEEEGEIQENDGCDHLYGDLRAAETLRFYDIELNTVDAFQGREKDIIVISCVRSNDMGNIGFLSDTRRMNVALTRARYGLFVIGNAATLRQNEHWSGLIDHAQSENSLVSIDSSASDILQSLGGGNSTMESRSTLTFSSSSNRGAKRKHQDIAANSPAKEDILIV